MFVVYTLIEDGSDEFMMYGLRLSAKPISEYLLVVSSIT